VAARRRLLLASQPLDFGVPSHVLDLIGELDTDRYDVRVACPPESMLWSRLRERPDVRLYPIGGARRPSPGDAVSFARLLRLVRGADVVHGHSSKAGFLVRLAAASVGRRARCIFTPHGWSFWAVEGREARLYLALERRAARWCRAMVAVSAYERDAGIAAGVGSAEQYRVIPNGIDLRRFAHEPQPVPGRIVMLGRLARPKRPELVVRALGRLRDHHPDAEVWLVGDGPLRAEVESLAASLGLAGGVAVTGRHHDIPAVLAGAHCLVLASDYEGMPLSLLEAMAAGVPVVVTRFGGVEEVVENGRTGFVVEPGSAEALAASLERLLDDPGLSRELGGAGRRRAEQRFSVRRMVAETASLYDEILARKAD
jgi:glycosyltransferase involved in cell wall biosynthesis